MDDIELKLPDDVLDNIPESKGEMINYLSKYFDGVLDKYNDRFQKRVQGVMGHPLSRYERAILKDLLMDLALGKLQEAPVSI